MTNLQAIQALTEYRNDTLMTKALIDHGLSDTGTYSATNEQDVDLALADVYLYLANHPEFAEGSYRERYNPATCIAIRERLYDKWGVALPEKTNAANAPTIDGTPVW